jgi:hypothetical protein
MVVKVYLFSRGKGPQMPHIFAAISPRRGPFETPFEAQGRQGRRELQGHLYTNKRYL